MHNINWKYTSVGQRDKSNSRSLMICNDRRSAIDDVKSECFMFPSAEIIHILLTKVGILLFHKRHLVLPPSNPLHSSLTSPETCFPLCIFPCVSKSLSGLLIGKVNLNPSVLLINLLSNLIFLSGVFILFFPSQKSLNAYKTGISIAGMKCLLLGFSFLSDHSPPCPFQI